MRTRLSLLLCLLLAACAGSRSGQRPTTAGGALDTLRVLPSFDASTRSSAVVLDSIRERTSRAARFGLTPVVIFDLDGTLFDNSTRSYRIFRTYAERHRATDPDLYARVVALDSTGFDYDVRQTLRSHTVATGPTLDSMMVYWGKTFFTNAFLPYDVPVAGSTAFVRDLYERGATILYLTGREAAGMETGTVASLRQHGFPVGEPRAELIMKPRRMADTDFKGEALSALRGRGLVIAVVENEPSNLNLLHERFPRAVPLFIQTTHRADAPPLAPGTAQTKTFTGR